MRPLGVFQAIGVERGAGRTFAKNGAAGVTLETLIADGIDLAQQLRQGFSEQKLIVFGHSWGSRIATGVAQQWPDLFDAYVGTGQVGRHGAVSVRLPQTPL